MATIFGLLVAFIAWLLVKLVGEPVLKYRSILGDLHACLMFNANVIFNPGVAEDLIDEARDSKINQIQDTQQRLRSYASELSSYRVRILGYHWLSKTRFVPEEDDLDEAVMALVGISNSLGSLPTVMMMTKTEEWVGTVKKNLDLYPSKVDWRSFLPTKGDGKLDGDDAP
jgi:hypothetical protein